MHDMVATMHTMARDAQREADQEIQRGGAQEEGQSQPRGESQALLVMQEFLRTNLPHFAREPDPMASEEWLEEMIKVFKTL